MARPSLADSLRASLNKGVHVEAAEKIARGFTPSPDDTAYPAVSSLATDTAVESSLPNVCSIPVTHVNEETNYKLNSSFSPTTGTISPETLVTTSDRQTVKRSDNVTVSPTDSLTVIQSVGQTVPRSDYAADRQSHGQTVSKSAHQNLSHGQTIYQTPLQYIPLEVLNLAYNQACILECLIANTSGLTNYRAISDQTHISIPSVREAVSRLVAKGFMHKPVTMKNAAFQGFSFILNKVLCDHFMAAGGLSQKNYNDHHTIPQTVAPSDSTTVQQVNSQTPHSSSGFSEDLKPTTTSPRQTVTLSDSTTLKPLDSPTIRQSDSTVRPSDGFILTGLVGAYWEEEGLGEGQAQKWCAQFETAPEQMRTQLEWARFDLENNNRRSEVKKDTVSWFFGHLRTTGGCFPRPINYKSPAELRAETIELDIAREKEARARIAAAEKEEKFQRILADPKGEDYLKLYNQVNDFAKGEGGIALQHALRDVFLI